MYLQTSDRDRSITPSRGTAVATVVVERRVVIRERILCEGPKDSVSSLLEIKDLLSSSLKKECCSGNEDERMQVYSARATYYIL